METQLPIRFAFVSALIRVVFDKTKADNHDEFIQGLSLAPMNTTEETLAMNTFLWIDGYPYNPSYKHRLFIANATACSALKLNEEAVIAALNKTKEPCKGCK